MIVIRDEQRIARLARLGQILSFAGLGALVLGLLFLFILQDDTLVFVYQLLALGIGLVLSQIGLYYSHRYQRTPRMDEVLDKDVGKVYRKNGRMYHYELPAPHVLLTPGAVYLFAPKFQHGRIVADGDNWKQSGLGLRGLFGQERLGNPTREAESMVSKMAAFIAAEAPSAVDVPLLPVIVFTSDNIESLDVENSRIPAMYHKKLSGYLRQQPEMRAQMSTEAYEALRAAFDEESGELMQISADAADST